MMKIYLYFSTMSANKWSKVIHVMMYYINIQGVTGRLEKNYTT